MVSSTVNDSIDPPDSNDDSQSSTSFPGQNELRSSSNERVIYICKALRLEAPPQMQFTDIIDTH